MYVWIFNFSALDSLVLMAFHANAQSFGNDKKLLLLYGFKNIHFLLSKKSMQLSFNRYQTLSLLWRICFHKKNITFKFCLQCNFCHAKVAFSFIQARNSGKSCWKHRWFARATLKVTTQNAIKIACVNRPLHVDLGPKCISWILVLGGPLV